jgi:hypothetical protein
MIAPASRLVPDASLLAVDLGGTRIKLGFRDSAGAWTTATYPSPATLAALFAIIRTYWQIQGKPSSWAIALPGRVALAGNYWMRSSAQFTLTNLGFEEFASLAKQYGLPAPVLLCSDTTALARGTIGMNTGILCQLSTELGTRVLWNGQPVAHHCIHEEFYATLLQWEWWTAPDGTRRRFREWCAWRMINTWLPPELAGCSLREFGIMEHPAVDYVAQAAATWVAMTARSAPGIPVTLAGGGAATLGKRIMEYSSEAAYRINLIDDTVLPGLQGIASLAEQGIAIV